MSQMRTTPVFKCRRCGRAVVVKYVATLSPDPTGEQLSGIMQNLGKIAFCKDCKNAYNYYAKEGRMEDFYAAGAGILIAHYDPRLEEVLRGEG